MAEGIGERLARTCRCWSRRLRVEAGDVGEEHLDELARLGEQSVGEVAARKGERGVARHRRWLGSHFGVEVHAGGRRAGPDRIQASLAQWRTATLVAPSVFVLRLGRCTRRCRVGVGRGQRSAGSNAMAILPGTVQVHWARSSGASLRSGHGVVGLKIGNTLAGAVERGLRF